MVAALDLSQVKLIGVVVCSAAAVIEDLRCRRIPNLVCGLLFSAGLLAAVIQLGVRGFESSMLGSIAGFCLFLVFYLMRGMGGGDVKLMGAYGSVLGFRGVLIAALIAAAAGAVLALGFICAGALRGRRHQTIPYAPAIAFGALAVLLSQSVPERN